MTRRSASFAKADLTNALSAARECGLSVHRVEFDANGRPVLHTSADPAATAGDDWSLKHAPEDAKIRQLPAPARKRA